MYFYSGTSNTERLAFRIRVRMRFRVQMDSIASGLFTEAPPTFTETSDGKVLIATGMTPMLVWDGRDFEAREAGVPAPSTAMTLAASGSGDIDGTYTAYQRWLDEDGNPSNFSLISNEVTATNAARITYTNVEAPTDDRIVTRQIIRTIAGEGGTYFLDIETTDLGQTTFESTRDDDELSVQKYLVLFTAEGVDLANRFAIPPNHKAYITSHNDRIFAAGERDYKTGHVEVTNGSTTVTGIGTAWTEAMEGRLLHVVGADQSYEIDAVDTAAQTLTLTENWVAATSKFGRYAIRPTPDEKRRIYYSELGLSQAWPATNALDLLSDADAIAGIFTFGSFLYVAEEYRLHRFTHKSDPAIDGFFFPATSRGIVNSRCVCMTNDTAFILDRKGVYSLTLGEGIEDVSAQIQDVFRPNGTGERINWAGRDFFHAAHFPSQETVRFFVSLSGTKYPRHALAYHYAMKRWWIEEFSRPVPASCLANMDMPRILLGSTAYKTLVLEDGTLDLTDPDKGTVRGTVTGASPFTITDTGATFHSSFVGSPLAIVTGRGKGQTRTITEVTATQLTVDLPWLIQPTATGDDASVYQVGGVEFSWRMGWLRTADSDTAHMQGAELMFEPTESATTMDFRQYVDHDSEPEPMGGTDNSDGVRTTEDDPDSVISLQFRYDEEGRRVDNGYAALKRGNFSESHTKSPATISYELRGYTNEHEVRVYELSVFGVREGNR